MIRFAPLMLLFAATLPAQEERKPLRWGMDSTGGAPYVFDNNTKGFEVELAAYLAKALDAEAEATDADWDKLPDLLGKKDLDIVLNGYEFSKAKFPGQMSVPYYLYRLSLTVHAKDDSIQTWDDLRKDGGKRVGVLEGSAAQTFMTRTFGDAIRLQVYKDVANTYDLVANGQLHATVQDNPAASYYVGKDTARLRQLKETKAPGAYVILTRAEDVELRNRIDAALRKAIDNGELEAILRKYGVWNEDQQRLRYWQDKEWTGGEEEDAERIQTRPIDWGESLKLLLLAAAMTVFLAVCAMPLAVAAGLGLATLRLYGPPLLRPFAVAYVEAIRGTPLLLQLFILYYVLPLAIPPLARGSTWLFHDYAPVAFGILGLAINYSASLAEHYRGAFLNLPRGQSEAGMSLGLTRWAMVRHILAPQAVRAAIPSVTNDFVAMFKDTAVCSVIAVMELTKQYNTLYNNHRDHILPLAGVTAGLYLLMSYPLSLATRRLEHRAEGH